MTIEQNNIENERILVTGANGFVGSFLTKKLINAGFEVITSTRKKNSISNTKDQFLINSLDSQVNWSKALDNCSTVVHLAARAHKINDKSNNILERYREINTNATINLGKQAIKAGVKKFIFISTIGVNGSKTEELPFINTDKPKPHSPYAISKYEAELGLQKITHNSSMKLIIIRPPLIYNINAPGNIERLKNIVELGLPLPFLGIKNKRSIISIENFTDLILKSIKNNNNLKSNVFLASNNKPISTKDLMNKIASDLGIKIRLFYFPVKIFYFVLFLFGKKKMAESLFDDLMIDDSYTKNIMDWSPKND